MAAEVLDEVRPESWRWSECQEDRRNTWPREQPSQPEIGQGWYDDESDCAYVWDGFEWVCVPAD